jgi:hypothetical protein
MLIVPGIAQEREISIKCGSSSIIFKAASAELPLEVRYPTNSRRRVSSIRV